MAKAFVMGTAASYLGSLAGGYVGGATGSAGAGAGAAMVTSAATQIALGYIFNQWFPGGKGAVKWNFEGMEAGDYSGLAALLGSLPGAFNKDFPFSGVSALNGLDYVPRDNFPIRAHQGEAVLDKRDADEWRGGSARGGVVINFNIEGNLIADENTFDEFVEKIDYRLTKLAGRRY